MRIGSNERVVSGSSASSSARRSASISRPKSSGEGAEALIQTAVVRRGLLPGLMILGVLLGAPQVGRAELDEKAVGFEASVLLPGFAAEDATAFALATWGLGGFGRYGVLDDLDLVVRGSFASFRGSMPHTESYVGRTLTGTLHASSSQLQLELGGRYKLCAGYDLAPYVEVTGGVLWTTLRDQAFTNPEGQSYGLILSDRSEGAMTIAVGIAADYRIFNMLFLGIAVRYTQALGGLYAHAVSIPVQLSYFW